MRTIWTESGNAINIKDSKDASISTFIQYEYLEKEGRLMEAALLLVENLLQFKEDMEIIKEMSVDEFGEFMKEWMGSDESA